MRSTIFALIRRLEDGSHSTRSGAVRIRLVSRPNRTVLPMPERARGLPTTGLIFEHAGTSRADLVTITNVEARVHDCHFVGGVAGSAGAPWGGGPQLGRETMGSVVGCEARDMDEVSVSRCERVHHLLGFRSGAASRTHVPHRKRRTRVTRAPARTSPEQHPFWLVPFFLGQSRSSSSREIHPASIVSSRLGTGPRPPISTSTGCA